MQIRHARVCVCASSSPGEAKSAQRQRVPQLIGATAMSGRTQPFSAIGDPAEEEAAGHDLPALVEEIAIGGVSFARLGHEPRVRRHRLARSRFLLPDHSVGEGLLAAPGMLNGAPAPRLFGHSVQSVWKSADRSSQSSENSSGCAGMVVQSIAKEGKTTSEEAKNTRVC